MTTTYKNNLKILSWNIEGLYKGNLCKLDIPNIRKLILEFDIVCLVETWYVGLFDVNGFKTYVSNRSYRHKKAKRESGGTAILVKNEIKKHINKQLSSSDDCIWMKLDRKYFDLKQNLYLCCSYLIPEKSSIFSWKSLDVCQLLERDVSKYSKLGDIYICGDLNSRTGNDLDYVYKDGNDPHISHPPGYSPDNFDVKRCNQDLIINSYGQWLLDLCISLKLCILNGRSIGDLTGRFTCFKTTGQSVVDYHISSKSLFQNVQFFKVENFTEWSDHCPVQSCLKINCCVQTGVDNTKLSPSPASYIWDDDSKQRYILSLRYHENTLKDFVNKRYEQTESEMAVKDFTNILHNIAKPSLKRRYVKVRRRKPTPGFDSSCQEVKDHLSYIKVLVERYPQNRDIKKSFYQTRKIFYKKLKQTESNFRKGVLEKLSELKDSNPTEYWSLLKSIKSEGQSNEDPIKPKVWLEHFKQLLSVPISDKDQFCNLLHDTENLLKHRDILDTPFTENEILTTIQKLKNKKSPGPDGILNEMLKAGKHYLSKAILKIMQLIFDSQHFPASWNKGILVKLFKSGDNTLPDNYRGIILSSALGKFLSMLLTNRLKTFLADNDKLSRFQCGFRDDHRTSDNLYILSRVIRYYKSKHNPLYACFIDFKKAFDRVNRDALLVKLLKIGVGGKFYSLVKSMHCNNQICIRINDKITEYFEMNIGVRQGDSLSPLLFNIFINDLANDLEQNNTTSAHLGSLKIGFLLYADDLILLSESAEGLQDQIDRVNAYCKTWALQINKNKSKIMIFNKRSTDMLHFHVDNESLEIVKEYKYLGVLITKSGSFSQAIKQLSSKGLKSCFAIKRYLSCVGYIPVKVWLHCFDAMVKPILLYGSEVWGQDLLHTTQDYSNNFMDSSSEIERIHLKFCKSLLCVPNTASNTGVRSELGRVPMILPIVSMILKYYSRLENMSSNRILKEVYNFESDKKFHLRNIAMHICNTIGIDLNKYKFSRVKDIVKFNRDAIDQLHFFYEEEWFISISAPTGKHGGGNKLRTYQTFKRKYCYENYLTYVNCINDRINLTKLRISAHQLRIEKGRYERKNNRMLPENERLCIYCGKNAIENEMHFVMSCTLYNHLRSKLLKSLCLDNVPPNEAFSTLMASKSVRVASVFSKYVSDCMEMRKNSKE